MSISSNNPTIETVNPLTLPITGRTLIEASAGTGKTYTITSIILRLLLNHLLHPKQSEPYQLQQILIVTFTRDSTAELKERIQKRLSEARQVFATGDTKDEFLLELLEQLNTQQKQALDALKLAEQSIHEAQIFTIHQFCLRLIKQFALETEQWFSINLHEDDQQLIEQFSQSFWRQHLYYAEGKQRLLYKTLFGKAPSVIEKQLRQWRSRATFRFSGISPLSFETLVEECIDIDNRLAQSWPLIKDELQEFFTSGSLNGNSYKPKSIPQWFKGIDATLEHNNLLINAANIHYFTFSKVEKAVKKSATLALSLHATDFLQSVEQLTESLQRLTVRYYQYQKQTFEDYLKTLYQEQQALTFDSVIRQTAVAINNTQGTIAKDIKDTLRVGLIDEFQDTDSNQYLIFKSLFEDPSQALMMIGDPKQAIYSFRGGDLHTYLKAKNEADHLFTLSTNWRSSKGLIEAMNQLYLNSELPFYSKEIEFLAVDSSPEAKPALAIGQHSLSPLLFFKHNEAQKINIKQTKSLIALHLASTIYDWLNQATLNNQALNLDDFAILVRSAEEANIIKAALEQYQLNSSYYSDKEHIFETEAAMSLRILLNAMEHPNSMRRLNTLLATPLFKKPLAYIQTLSTQEREQDLQAWRESLGHAARSLKQSNIFEALHGFLTTHHIQPPSSHLASKEQRRFLTHFFHLIELLHEQFPKEKKLHVLVNYLLKQQQQPDASESQDIRKRIEDTQKRISIYTLHKSKGLQFNIVFLPFVSFYKDPRDTFYFYHDDQQGLKAQPKSTADDSIKTKAELEIKQENARLLYVGLTRAINHCVVYLEPNYKVNQTELGRLIHADDNLDSALEYLSGVTDSEIQETQPISAFQTKNNPIDTLQLSAAEFQRNLEKPWQITSYTAITAKSTQHHYEVKNEDHSDDEPIIVDTVFSEFSRSNFPKGAQIGIFWHDWLEHSPFNSPADTGQLLALLQRYQLDAHWQNELIHWRDDVLEADLGNQLSLATLNKTQTLPEMEFLLSIDTINAQSLNAVFKNSPICAKQALRFDDVKGFMTGFIDLVFEYQGQYFVLDYKTNYLGSSIEDYHQDKLLESLQGHRYDVQLLIYCLALDLHLEKTLIDYDYHRDFGGAYYLFLRGMQANKTSGVFFHKPDYAIIKALKQLIIANPEGVRL